MTALKAEMERIWIVQVSNSILGPVVPQARPKGGRYRLARELPAPIRQYLNLPDTGRPRLQDFAKMADLDAVPLDECLLRKTTKGYTRLLTIRLPDSVMPPPKRPKRQIPKGTPAIRTLADLCAYFGADAPRLLNRRIYKSTECGASISVLPIGDKWLHNGSDPRWESVTAIMAFTIQTIVEGSDAEVNSDVFELPITVAEMEHWIADMEAEADRLWHEANDDSTAEVQS